MTLRAVALILVAATLAPSFAHARSTCWFFCAPAARHHHYRAHHPVYIRPVDPASVPPPDVCKQINESAADLTKKNRDRIRASMSTQQVAVWDKCAAGVKP